MSIWEDVRKEFPSLSEGTYLNTAGGCAMSRSVASAGTSYYQEHCEHGDRQWNKWLEHVSNVRMDLSHILKCKQSNIAFLGNTSFGLSIAQMLCRQSGPVVLSPYDFPSVTLPSINAKRDYRFLETRDQGQISLEQLEEMLRDGARTIFISHVNYSTGYRIDLKAVSALAKSYKADLVVDATQSFGAYDIPVGSDEYSGISCLVFSGYKWSLAGYGIAALYVKDELLQGKELPMIGWRSAKDAYKMLWDEVSVVDSASALELGHPPFPGIFALGAALKMQQDIGIEKITDRINFLQSHLYDGFSRLNLEVASSRSSANTSGIMMLHVPNVSKVVKQLSDAGVFVSERNGKVRISTHFYNDENDIDVLLKALEAVV